MSKPLVGVEHREGCRELVEAPEARNGLLQLVRGLARLRLIEQAAQAQDLLFELLVLCDEIGELEALACEVAHFQRDRARRGAAVDLDIFLALGAEHQVEGVAMLGERLHRGVEFGGRARIEPKLGRQEPVSASRGTPKLDGRFATSMSGSPLSPSMSSTCGSAASTVSSVRFGRR